jgi:hypothetical protein
MNPQPPSAGLCASCQHAKVIQSDRGSAFYQCLRGLTDPSFPKYPRLPVIACRGYEEDTKSSLSLR